MADGARVAGEGAATDEEGLQLQGPLPPVLRTADGAAIESAVAWRAWRPRLVELFERHIYGRGPAEPPEIDVIESVEDRGVLDGLAVRKQLRVLLRRGDRSMVSQLMVYLPAAAESPSPLFLGLNFYGNQTVSDDPRIQVTEAWVRDNEQMGAAGHRVTEASRGASAGRWPVGTILARGYGLATACYGDFDPDFDDGFQNGVHRLYPEIEAERGDGGAWGAIGAWVWGLSRLLDVLRRDPAIDADRVIAMGHSRLGKTALWAGALDERFAAAISNNSGCGGASLSRRRIGETLAAINERFPHWFCGRFHGYVNREEALPVDQHQLIALAAPRPVYVASAVEDTWADPRGEYLSAHFASPVWRLFGHEGLDAFDSPPVDTPRLSRVGYHIRQGGHGVTEYDWLRYLDFADRWVTGAATR